LRDICSTAVDVYSTFPFVESKYIVFVTCTSGILPQVYPISLPVLYKNNTLFIYRSEERKNKVGRGRK
jgi:hypothetical protein